MNVIKQLIQRIEKRAKETKHPCCLYVTEDAAERRTSRIAAECAKHHNCKESARYVVFYIQSLDKWTGAVDLTELLKRQEAVGGYVGYCGDKGIYTY